MVNTDIIDADKLIRKTNTPYVNAHAYIQPISSGKSKDLDYNTLSDTRYIGGDNGRIFSKVVQVRVKDFQSKEVGHRSNPRELPEVDVDYTLGHDEDHQTENSHPVYSNSSHSRNNLAAKKIIIKPCHPNHSCPINMNIDEGSERIKQTKLNN